MVKFEKIISLLYLLRRGRFSSFQIAVEICSDNDPVFAFCEPDFRRVRFINIVFCVYARLKLGCCGSGLPAGSMCLRVGHESQNTSSQSL